MNKVTDSIKVGDIWQNIRDGELTTITAIGRDQVLCLSDGSSFEKMIPIDAALFTIEHTGKLIERDGKAIKPETLEDRIKAEYSDYDVVMLKWGGNNQHQWVGPFGLHFKAQSMKGFYKYIYNEEGDLFHEYEHPTKPWKGKTLKPVGVLFSRGEE